MFTRDNAPLLPSVVLCFTKVRIINHFSDKVPRCGAVNDLYQVKSGLKMLSILSSRENQSTTDIRSVGKSALGHCSYSQWMSEDLPHTRSFMNDMASEVTSIKPG